MDTVNVELAENNTEVNNVIAQPIKCHCSRCHHEWETRDHGEGHIEPSRCSTCRSAYWKTAPKIWLQKDFTPSTITCDKCKVTCEKIRKTRNLTAV
ncbi:MAG: hypothetical protein FD167_2730 [bacterium]|nr:MAG: hypothetical protein FD167_2730 [bacterium]